MTNTFKNQMHINVSISITHARWYEKSDSSLILSYVALGHANTSHTIKWNYTREAGESAQWEKIYHTPLWRFEIKFSAAVW